MFCEVSLPIQVPLNWLRDSNSFQMTQKIKVMVEEGMVEYPFDFSALVEMYEEISWNNTFKNKSTFPSFDFFLSPFSILPMWVNYNRIKPFWLF